MSVKKAIVLAVTPLLLIIYFRIIYAVVMLMFSDLDRADAIFATILTFAFSGIVLTFFGLSEEARGKS